MLFCCDLNLQKSIAPNTPDAKGVDIKVKSSIDTPKSDHNLSWLEQL